MSSDSEDDWRSMRRTIPLKNSVSSILPSETKKKKIVGVVVESIPGGLKFVRPGARLPQIDDGDDLSGKMESKTPVAFGDRKMRRGEVGKDMDQVVKLETSGFVMTGSRNSRMTMLNEIKQSETVTDDQRKEELLEKMNAREKREEELLSGFRQLLLKKQRMR